MCVFGYRVSSEDSGELPFYIEDSDDSCELEPEARQTGQMSLLEEILDSLSTTTLDHGSKLSSAKSLDFFRSMDELDCSTPVRPDLGMFFSHYSNSWYCHSFVCFFLCNVSLFFNSTLTS